MTTKMKAALNSKKTSWKITKQQFNKLSLQKKAMHILGLLFRYAFLITLGMIIIKPLYETFKNAITNQSMMGLRNSVWVPPAVSELSLLEASMILNYSQSLLYSILNTGMLALLQTMCAAFAAYSFARLKFKGSNLLFGLVVFTIIVPPDSIMLSQYMTFRNFDILGLFQLFTGDSLNLIGSTGAVYLLAATGMGVKGGLYIYILRQAFRQFPVSIEEAAYVDGAGFVKTFFTIVLPGVSSSLLTVGVLSFVWNYADTYYMSLLNPTQRQLSLRLASIQNDMKAALREIMSRVPTNYVFQQDSPYVHLGVAAACAFLVILPLVIGYALVQKRFIQGVERSGLGGD